MVEVLIRGGLQQRLRDRAEQEALVAQ
ncbi:hypothetical protein ABIB26_003154 [Arthrobacter sp. UYEF20]